MYSLLNAVLSCVLQGQVAGSIMPTHPVTVKGHTDRLYSQNTAFNPKPRLVVPRVTAKCLFCNVLQGHSGWVNDADITRDGMRVVTVSGDHRGAVWDVVTGEHHMECAIQLLCIYNLAFNEDKRFAVCVELDAQACYCSKLCM